MLAIETMTKMEKRNRPNPSATAIKGNKSSRHKVSKVRVSTSRTNNQPSKNKCRAGCIITDRTWTKVLLVKGFSKWGFPKGHVDPGESLTDTAEREVYEETGIKVTLDHTEQTCYDHITLFYATVDERLCVPVHDDEVVQTRWVPVDELYTWDIEQLNGSVKRFVIQKHSPLPLSKRGLAPPPCPHPPVDSSTTSYRRYPEEAIGAPETEEIFQYPSYVEYNDQLYSTIYWDQTIWDQWWIMTAQVC